LILAAATQERLVPLPVDGIIVDDEEPDGLGKYRRIFVGQGSVAGHLFDLEYSILIGHRMARAFSQESANSAHVDL
jgi:hypothetical protein